MPSAIRVVVWVLSLHKLPNVIMACNRCILDCLSAFRGGVHRFPVSLFHGSSRLVDGALNLGLDVASSFANTLFRPSS